MNKTQNYQLNQWEAGDKVQRVDFNADNAKIDAAIHAVDGRVDGLSGAKADQTALNALSARAEAIAASIPKLAAGTYTGDGAESRFISLGFTPKAVLVIPPSGRLRYDSSSFSYYTYGGLAVTGSPAVDSRGLPLVAVQPGGFQVAEATTEDSAHVHHYTYGNHQNSVYNYIAIG